MELSLGMPTLISGCREQKAPDYWLPILGHFGRDAVPCLQVGPMKELLVYPKEEVELLIVLREYSQGFILKLSSLCPVNRMVQGAGLEGP